MPYEQYLSAGMHIGMKQQTKDMKKFIYKVREDGLAVLNMQTIEKRIQMAGKFIAQFSKIMAVSRKNVGWKPVERFIEVVNGKSVLGRFLPGTITNPSFREYYEPEVIIVTDPLVDSQATKEALKARIPIIALSDTSNETGGVDIVIPVNNKGRKSLAMVYFLLAKEVLKNRGVKEEEMTFKPEEFEMVGEE